jgi:thiosulfate/3-mercaptopyruvate sulfurtransferase
VNTRIPPTPSAVTGVSIARRSAPHHDSDRGAILWAAAITFAVCAHGAWVQAQTSTGETAARARLVVTTAWLAEHAKDPNLVVLDVGRESDYLAGHIPGARHIELSQISANADMKNHDMKALMVEMLPPSVLRTRLSALGIGNQSRIVVYPNNDDYLPGATRALFTLAYAGLGSQSSLLDGGFSTWRREGHPVTETVPRPPAAPGRLTVAAQPALVVDAAWVKQHLASPGTKVVDARAAVFYDGVEMGESRRGHVHGAGSLPFTSVVDDSLKLRSPAALEALFRHAAVAPGDTVVAYCHIGLQATVVILAAETLGHPVRLYDGSFQDWSRQMDLPVDDPSGKGGKE